MPVVVPLIAAAAAVAASSAASAAAVALGIAAAGSFAAAAIGGIVGAVVSFAVSYAANALLGTSKSSSASSSVPDSSASDDRTQQIRQAVGPHVIILGRVRVSGTMVYIYSPNAARPGFASAVKGNVAYDYKPNQLLYTVIALAGHPVSAINDIMLDDVAITDPKYSGYGYVEASLGATDPQRSPHFVQANNPLNSRASETDFAKAVMSGASLCSGMVGISS